MIRFVNILIVISAIFTVAVCVPVREKRACPGFNQFCRCPRYQSGCNVCPTSCTQNYGCNTTQPADIVFILDASGSLRIPDFEKTLHFTQAMVDILPVGTNGAHIGMITFSSRVYLQFHLNTYMDRTDIKNAISHARYTGRDTYTAEAIKYARQTLFQPQNGMRANSAKIAIIVTDGQSDDIIATLHEAVLLRHQGVTIFSIGVGSKVSAPELKVMAKDPDDTHVFQVTDFNSLNTIIGSLASQTCKAFSSTYASRQTPTAKTTSSTAAATATHAVVTPIQTLRCNTTQPDDIVFILDASGSLGLSNFKKTLDFTNKMVDSLPVGTNGAHIGLITFDTNVHLQFHLNTYVDKTDIKNAISRTSYTAGVTNTAEAIKYARQTSFQPQNGMRANAAKITIIVTDGQSKDPIATLNEAVLLRHQGITIFSIGVGSKVSAPELKVMATDPDDTHVFQVTDFNSLNTIIGSLASRTCNAFSSPYATGQTPTKTTTTSSTTATTTKAVVTPKQTLLSSSTYSTGQRSPTTTTSSTTAATTTVTPMQTTVTTPCDDQYGTFYCTIQNQHTCNDPVTALVACAKTCKACGTGIH